MTESKMTESKKKFLDARTTSYILQLYRNAYALCSQYMYYNPSANTYTINVYDKQSKNTLFYSIYELKEYLNTRPHVLNKKESKALRKEKIKRGV